MINFSNCPAATVVVTSQCAEHSLTFSTVTLANELRAQSLLVPGPGNTPALYTNTRWLTVMDTHTSDWLSAGGNVWDLTSDMISGELVIELEYCLHPVSENVSRLSSVCCLQLGYHLNICSFSVESQLIFCNFKNIFKMLLSCLWRAKWGKCLSICWWWLVSGSQICDSHHELCFL